MGTTASYSGSGSKPAKDVRSGIANWLNSQSGSGGSTIQPNSNLPQRGEEQQPPSKLPYKIILPAVALLHSRSNGGTGGKGSGSSSSSSSGGGSSSRGNQGGAQRSSHRSASTVGRAAAVAYAFSKGDRETLKKLGVSYDELKKITDPLDLTRKIVEVACGAQDSTIEDHELRIISADVADWVLEQADKGSLPEPEDIVRKSIATLISEIVASETGEMLRQGEWSREEVAKVEPEICEAAEVLAEKAELSIDGVTDEEFARAIEEGVETLQKIIRSDK